jgi:uncharacterized membrane-anchored protein YitT (DUF2179 family)
MRRRSRLRRRALIALLFTGLLMLAALGIVLRIGETLAGTRRRALGA